MREKKNKLFTYMVKEWVYSSLSHDVDPDIFNLSTYMQTDASDPLRG